MFKRHITTISTTNYLPNTTMLLPASSAIARGELNCIIKPTTSYFATRTRSHTLCEIQQGRDRSCWLLKLEEVMHKCITTGKRSQQTIAKYYSYKQGYKSFKYSGHIRGYTSATFPFFCIHSDSVFPFSFSSVPLLSR